MVESGLKEIDPSDLWNICALTLQSRDHHIKGCHLLDEQRQKKRFMEVIW